MDFWRYNIGEKNKKKVGCDAYGNEVTLENCNSKTIRTTPNFLRNLPLQRQINEENIIIIYGFGYIYKITNKINNKVYIGQTRQNPERRWIQHKSAARMGEIHPLYNSMRYHGINNFTYEIIEKANVENLNNLEMNYIRFYKSNITEYGYKYGYNLTAGGLGMTYKYIDKAILEDLILHGLLAEEICQEIGVGMTALYTRLYQLWEQRSLEQIRRALMREKVKDLIIEGKDITDIANELNMTRNFIYDRLVEIWNVTSIFDARLIFRKEIIEDLLKKGALLQQIAEKLGMSRFTVPNYIYEYWGMPYAGAKHYFMKPYIKSLIERGLSEKEIISELFVKNYETVNKYINEYWGMNFLHARDSFFIKPILETIILEGYDRDEIAAEFSVLPLTINEYTQKFWNKTFTQTRKEFYLVPQLTELLKQDYDVPEIATRLNLDKSTIYKYIKEDNSPIKSWWIKKHCKNNSDFEAMDKFIIYAISSHRNQLYQLLELMQQ